NEAVAVDVAGPNPRGEDDAVEPIARIQVEGPVSPAQPRVPERKVWYWVQPRPVFRAVRGRGREDVDPAIAVEVGHHHFGVRRDPTGVPTDDRVAVAAAGPDGQFPGGRNSDRVPLDGDHVEDAVAGAIRFDTLSPLVQRRRGGVLVDGEISAIR